MREKTIIFFALIFSMLIGFGWKNDTHAAPPYHALNQQVEINPQSIVREMIDQVNQDRALTDLRRLTGVEPICTSNGCTTLAGRETGTQDLQWAKDYVYETLINLHYSVEVLDWNSGSYSDQNILAHKQGRLYPDEEIYFIAHLDGYLEENPAADDDASGAVSLLELARILSTRQLSRSVTLFFSTGEEHGSLGSHRFVAEYPERLGKIKYLVSIEMLGYDSNDDGIMELWNGSDPLDFVQLLSSVITFYEIGLTPEIVSGCT
ncbi:MAG: M28 family peptidase [Anaerolineales bacterium]